MMGKRTTTELLGDAGSNFTNAERQILTTYLDGAIKRVSSGDFTLAKDMLINAAKINNGNFDEVPDLHAQLHAVRAFYLACGGTGLPFTLANEIAAAKSLNPNNALLKKVLKMSPKL